MTAATPAFGLLDAEPGWRSIDLLSDLHLLRADATFDAWRRHLAATPADAIFILGDLFEAWVGGDAALVPGFAAQCAQVLREAARRAPVFFMHGNRDFLVGDAFVKGCGITLLADPTLLTFGGRRWLLAHGDALCLADPTYLRYREQVRSPDWIAHFMAKPLPEREAMARQMREASQMHQRALPAWADVDADAARRLLREAGTDTLIHGHTHHPAEHDLGEGLRRVVLSDWDLAADPPRAEVMRLHVGGRLERLPPAN